MAKHRLQEILDERELSHRKFSFLIKMEYKNVPRLFRPSYDPKLSTLTKWAKALGIKVCDLIKE